MPYKVIVVGADIVASPYDPVALARTFHTLIGPLTRVYASGKAQLAWPHLAFEGEMVRLFARVQLAQEPGHFHHHCQWQKGDARGETVGRRRGRKGWIFWFWLPWGSRGSRGGCE